MVANHILTAVQHDNIKTKFYLQLGLQNSDV